MLKIKHDIVKMAKAKRSLAIRQLDKDRSNTGWQNARDEADEFIKDVDDNWSENVSRLAHSNLSERKLNRTNHLSKPEDVQQLSIHLLVKSCTAIKQCKVSKTSKRHLLLECEIQLGNIKPTSALLRTEVLPIMTSDLVSKTAQGDNLRP